LADKFVLARIVNMRGVDLTTFDFDYDLTWAAFFMNANEYVYGRYGGRDEGPADKGLSIEGLAYAMQSALSSHAREPNARPKRKEKDVRSVERFAAARRLKKNQCIHCHQVYDFRREQLTLADKWSKDEVWVYPPPKNLGFALALKQGDRIESVSPDSPAAKAGLRADDILSRLGETNVASYADAQYALHRAPKSGALKASWTRGDRSMTATISLKNGWRESDITWRGSMWGLEPQAYVYGRDLTVAQKRELDLSPKRLAFSQGNFVPRESRQAGVRARDVIVGIDGKELEMKMLEFNAYVRLNYKVGDRITLNVFRNGKSLKIPMTLTSRIRGR
jgi:membrane-associated protease RseP (regulator of RpoE activity)